MIELHINESLIILLIVIGWIAKGVLNIVAGATGMEKSTEYDSGNILVGVIMLIVVIIILIL